MYAEALQFCSLMQEETRTCMQLLQQAIDAQNPEVSRQMRRHQLTCQNQTISGESSIEGSITMETTPPQASMGISPASLKVFHSGILISTSMLTLSSGNQAQADLRGIVSHQGHLRLLSEGNSLR